MTKIQSYTLIPIGVTVTVYTDSKGVMTNGRRKDKRKQYNSLSELVDELLKAYCNTLQKRNSYIQFCEKNKIQLGQVGNPFVLPVPMFNSEILKSGLLVITETGEL